MKLQRNLASVADKSLSDTTWCEDLEKLKARIDRNSFGDYCKNLATLSDEKSGKQKRKSEAFIEEAITSLDNHYLRWCNILLSAALGGEAPLAKIIARILLKYHLPDNPNEQNQIDAEYFSKDHNRHANLLDFAIFVRENHIRETEMEDATQRLAVASIVDIWKVEDRLTQNDSDAAKLRDHFCNCYLPIASNSQFVEAGVKEAKIVSTTGRNDEALCVRHLPVFFVWKAGADKEHSSKNPPNIDCGHQSEFDSWEQNYQAWKKRGKKSNDKRSPGKPIPKREVGEETKENSKKGSHDKADNVTPKLEGVHDTAFIDGKTQYGKLRMSEHTEDLNTELSLQGLEEFILVPWTDKIEALKKREQQRVRVTTSTFLHSPEHCII
jgi:hypothetical protein